MEINKIYNEDCLEGMKRIPDGSVDLIVTDPPYKTTSRGNAGNSGGMLRNEENMKGRVFKHNDIKFEYYLPEFYRILKPRGHCYVMVNHKNLYNALSVAKESGFTFIKSLIWNKGNKIMGGFYMSQFEYILFFRKGEAKRINNCGTSDLLSIPNKKTKDEEGKNIHDTEKPVELMKVLIENSSFENDIVLDPFMGIGTTAVAAMNTNRQYIGFELDEYYYNVAMKRLNNHDPHKQIDLFEMLDN